MDQNLFRKLKRKPKRKLRQERDDLYGVQEALRVQTDALRRELESLKNDEIAALKSNDGETITLLDHRIEVTSKKIAENEERYKRNAEILEIYSKILKNDREGRSSLLGSIFGAVGTVGGLGFAAYGLKKAYQSDQEGSLVQRKTLDWVKQLPILRRLGGGKM